MISSIKQFDLAFENAFGEIKINKHSLSNISKERIRFNLGGDLHDVKSRVNQSLLRSKQILTDCFKGEDTWLRITLWNHGEKDNLIKAGLKIDSTDVVLEENIDGDDILVLYKNNYSESFFNTIILSNINYEIGETPSANFTCYFINFSIPVVVNIYDDRGIDIVTPSRRTKIN